MRRIVTWCIDGFPFDARSRRAIEETLADWAYEEGQDSNRPHRALASLRGALSVGRVVSGSLAREAFDFTWARGLAPRFGFTAALATLLALGQASRMLPAIGVTALPLALATLPLTLLAILPPATFLILAWRPAGRTVPTAGATCLLAVATLALAAWLVPLSSDLANAILRPALGVTNAGADVPAPPQQSLARSAIALHVTSWCWLTAAAATFATKLAKRSPLRSPWWLAGVPAIYAALIASLQPVIGTSFLVLRNAGDPEENSAQALALWIAGALVMTATVAWRREDGRVSAESC